MYSTVLHSSILYSFSCSDGYYNPINQLSQDKTLIKHEHKGERNQIATGVAVAWYVYTIAT